METGKSRMAGTRVHARPLKPCTFERIHWDVREFCLVESVTHEKGARYRVLRTWGLAWQDSVVELRGQYLIRIPLIL